MAIFYIKVEMIDGLRQMTGCTESKEYAQTNWGLGKYAKVLADNAHEVKAESIKQGLTDAVTGKPKKEETVECKLVANATATTIRHIEDALGITKPENENPKKWAIKVLKNVPVAKLPRLTKAYYYNGFHLQGVKVAA